MDLLTNEQKQLERLRELLKTLKDVTLTKPSKDSSEYMQGFYTGVQQQHDLILTMLDSALNAEPKGWTDIEC